MLQPRPPNTVVPHQSHVCAPTCVRAYKHTHTHTQTPTHWHLDGLAGPPTQTYVCTGSHTDARTIGAFTERCQLWQPLDERARKSRTVPFGDLSVATAQSPSELPKKIIIERC